MSLPLIGPWQKMAGKLHWAMIRFANNMDRASRENLDKIDAEFMEMWEESGQKVGPDGEETGK